MPDHRDRSADRKTAAKTAVAGRGDPTPTRILQAHGGALLAGGAPGNPGGPGRPPTALRERLRGSLEQRVQVLEEIADDPEADSRDRIRAIDVLAKYGLGTLRELSVEDVRDRLRQTIAIVRGNLPPERVPVVLMELREVWTR